MALLLLRDRNLNLKTMEINRISNISDSWNGILSQTSTTGEWKFKEDGEELYLQHQEVESFFNQSVTMDELILEDLAILHLLEILNG